MTRALSTRILALFLALLIGVPAWGAKSLATPELPDPGQAGMSREKQEQLGLKVVPEVYRQMPVLPDSNPVAQYVQQVGKKLMTVIPPDHSWPYQFHVIQQTDINAFALPGGPIFVNIGTINAARNEAELAGVLSHEMSHVYMQHSAKQLHKQEWASILGALGGAIGGDLGRMGIQLGAGTFLMHYSRKDEAQADAVGAVIMYKAGYNPRAMAEFFQNLEKIMGNGGPQFLSDHPNPGNRVAAVDKEIANWPPKNYLGTSRGFEEAKQQAKGVAAYNAQQIADGAKSGRWALENQKNGAVPPGGIPAAPAGADAATISNVSYQDVAPSADSKNFQGTDFSIAYPANWQVGTGERSATIAPAAGVGQNAIAYGVIVASSPNVDATSLNDATQALIQTLQQTNPGLRVYESPRKIQIAGGEALSTMLASNSPITRGDKPLAERDWLVTLRRSEGGMLHMVFIAPENDFPRLQPTYEKMLDSLQLK